MVNNIIYYFVTDPILFIIFYLQCIMHNVFTGS